MDVHSGSYLDVNLANWNSRVPHHVKGYPLDSFRTDPTYLSDVVRFDVPRLGDISGLDVVHLQCHIGTDTLSLSRLGARSVAGLDFSQPALDVAAALATDCGASIRYVCSNVYEAAGAFDGDQFDLVFTGIGALCWLPDVRRWAEVVASLLRPGGRLFIREGHPMLWSLSEPRDDELLVVEYPYFERPEGMEFSEETTYVEQDGPVASPDMRTWNHGLGQIISAITDAGLVVTAFEEHQSVPWNALGTAMVELPNGEFELRDQPDRLAASYTLQARRA
jgi:SAM-dependent methyltransferase